ncbi:MAG: POTRA domain-containing protein [Planctomycetota bacterium]
MTKPRFVSIKLCVLLSVCVAMISFSAAARSQPGMGGGGGGGGAGMPAFNEPTFKERLYEAGGIPSREIATEGSVILSVKVEGNQSISESFILSQMQSREDRAFDKETFNRDISALYRSSLFRKIDPYFTQTPEGVHIRLIVSERPIIRSVEFLGNERLEDGALKKHAGVQKGDPLDPISVNSAKSRLIEFYQDKGMNQVDVQIIKGLKPSDRDVQFLISEGPVERINSIRIIGNVAFTEELLKARIKSRDSRMGITMYIGNKCSDLKLNEDRDALLAYYRSLGYFDARVDYQKSYNEAGDFVDVTFVISEGERYTINSVSIVGMERYQPEELLPNMKMKSTNSFLQTNKLKDEKLLRDVFGAQGHIFCDVEGEVIYQPDHRVDIIYRVREGDIYRASDIRVHIDGDFTKRHVVLQPLRNLRPGAIIDSRELENGERRLRYSTIFNTDPSRGEVPRIEVQPPEKVDDNDF